MPPVVHDQIFLRFRNASNDVVTTYQTWAVLLLDVVHGLSYSTSLYLNERKEHYFLKAMVFFLLCGSCLWKTRSYYNMTVQVQVHLELLCFEPLPQLNLTPLRWTVRQTMAASRYYPTSVLPHSISLLMLWLNESKSPQTGSKNLLKGLPKRVEADTAEA